MENSAPKNTAALRSFADGVEEKAAPSPDVVETVGGILPAARSDEEHSLSPALRELVKTD